MLFDRAATSAELFKHANHERRPSRWSFEKSGGGDSRAWRDVRPQATATWPIGVLFTRQTCN